jgi:hypothetical protein
VGNVSDLHDGYGIIVKDGRDIFGGEFVGGIADEKTGLAYGTIAHDHTSTDLESEVSRRKE